MEDLREPEREEGGGCQLQAVGGGVGELVAKKKIGVFEGKNKTFTTLSPLPYGVPSPSPPYFHMYMGCLSQQNTKTGGVGGFTKKHLHWIKTKNLVFTCFLTQNLCVPLKLRLPPPFPNLTKFKNLKYKANQPLNNIADLTENLI